MNGAKLQVDPLNRGLLNLNRGRKFLCEKTRRTGKSESRWLDRLGWTEHRNCVWGSLSMIASEQPVPNRTVTSNLKFPPGPASQTY